MSTCLIFQSRVVRLFVLPWKSVGLLDMPIWAAAQKGPMTYAFTDMGNFTSYLGSGPKAKGRCPVGHGGISRRPEADLKSGWQNIVQKSRFQVWGQA